MFDKIIKEMFATREMDFMPDLVIAKLITEHRAKPGSRGSAGLLTGECKMGLREMQRS
jgi:hypothetical protein